MTTVDQRPGTNGWRVLDVVEVTGDALQVEVKRGGETGYLRTDAVRVERLSDPFEIYEAELNAYLRAASKEEAASAASEDVGTLADETFVAHTAASYSADTYSSHPLVVGWPAGESRELPAVRTGHSVDRCSPPGPAVRMGALRSVADDQYSVFDVPQHERTSAEFFANLQGRIRARASGPLIPSRDGRIPRREFEKRPVTVESIASALEATAGATKQPIANLAAFHRGELPAGRILGEHPRHGRHFWPGNGAPEVQRVLDYLQCAKVVSGEMDVRAVPCYAEDYFGFIDPARDWYKTPLLRVEK